MCTHPVCSYFFSCRIKLYGYVELPPNINATVCAWRREKPDLKTVSYVHRMNVDELGLQQHERGFVTIRLSHWHFISCHVLGHIGTEFSMFVFVVFFILQVTMEFGLDKRAQTLQGLAFPLQEEAKRALQQLKQRRINYIQLVSPDRRPLSLITQRATCNMFPVNRNKLSGSIFST